LAFKNFIGWDTETIDGYVYLIGYYDLNSKKYIYRWLDRNMPHEEKREIILKMLTTKKLAGSYNAWFNIQFDFESIMKTIFTEENLKEIAIFSYTKFDKKPIGVIKRKTFSIDKQKFYDLYQFYNTSLNNVCKQYGLGEKLEIENFDYGNWKWIKENKELIIEYHKQDCILTAKLAELTARHFESIDMIFEKPISVASISAHTFKSSVEYYGQPDFFKHFRARKYRNFQYADFMYKAFTGGLFDCWRSGKFNKVWSYDINSAYPRTIAELLSLKETRIYELDEENADLDHAVYLCNVEFRKPFLLCRLP